MGGVRASLNTGVYVKHEEALDFTISAMNNPKRCKVESLFVCKYCFDSVSLCTSAGLKLKSTCFGFPRARITDTSHPNRQENTFFKITVVSIK